MKYLGKSELKYTGKELFRIALNSISGCKVKVGDELYSLWKEDDVVKCQKINIEFELTEEEFKKLNVKND
jgi:hypothetical protein